MDDTVVLNSAGDPTVAVTVIPAAGGRIAQIEVAGRPLLIAGDDPDSMAWGSFPMAPWAGRIRDGRFEFDGVEHRLAANAGPHAMHGTTFDRPWDVLAADERSVHLRIDLGWDLGGIADQSITLRDDVLECVLTVRAGTRAMPAELGWHPWFVKPDDVSFHPDAMYRRDGDGIAVDELGPPMPGPWDDCFVNTSPVVLAWGDVALTLTSDCDHWVVYDEPIHATCVEPQSGPPDAFNIRPAVLRAGAELTRTFRLRWAKGSA